jgi:flagellum-specific peptidoglycan hydrolase FlgJ
MAGGYAVTFEVVDHASTQIDAINRRIAAMRAPIDRMSRSISKFVDVSGLRKVAEGFGWIARAGAAAFRSLIAIVPVLGAITSAATIAGMAKLVSSFSAWGRDLAIAADQIGIAPQKLQQFEDAARLAGGSADDMRQSLQGLKDTATRALEGQDPMGMAYFNQLGINLRDSNGQMRAAADLLPEVVQKLEAIEDPTDRARKATALLGDAGAKLVESLRVSRRSLGDWMTDASKFTELTQEQLQTMIQFEQSQNKLGVAFDHLGQQVAAVLAKNVIPLFDHLSDFVQQHQPEIIAAVDKIAARFAEWLDNPATWKSIEAGVTTLLHGLEWVSTHLDTIKDAAEAVAAVFATDWLIGIATAIARVTAALGSAGGVAGGVIGTGLLGALAGIAAIAATLAIGAHYETPETQRKREENRKDTGTTAPPNMPTVDTWTDKEGRQHDATTGEIVQPSTPFSGSQKDFYQQTYNDLYDAAKAQGIEHPEIVAKLGAAQASIETGYGQHQVGNNIFGIKAPPGAASVSAVTTEHVGGQDVKMTQDFAAFKNTRDAAAGYIAFLKRNPRYAGVLGAKSDEEAVDALGRSGYATDPNYKGKVAGVEGRYGATPAAVPPAARINGAVDVSITHKNPPPDSAVTATGSGSVNVAPPRVEHSAMADT